IGVVREIAPDNYQLTFEDQFGNEGFSAFAEDINGELYAVGLLSGTISRIVDANLSIPEDSLSALKMYPNPTSGILNFDSTGSPLQLESIKFFDILGKNVKTISGFTGQRISISTKELRSGIYIVEIISISGNVCTRKLVVN
ncbi:MAG: T9SS type A sorting domain-containing protein, partial [Psychroserpens sp.]|nr:T9SS type A sorting domain-containing protein [Psychroserpens sp.]